MTEVYVHNPRILRSTCRSTVFYCLKIAFYVTYCLTYSLDGSDLLIVWGWRSYCFHLALAIRKETRARRWGGENCAKRLTRPHLIT